MLFVTPLRMEESIKKRISAARNDRHPSWHNSALLHAVDMIHTSSSRDQPRAALIVLESFEAMVGDIECALENEDFKEKWAQGGVSFFLWDGHNEERDVDSKERRLAKVLNSGETCGEKGACWHVMDKEVARWVETCKDLWKDREKRYNFLESIVQSEWKQQRRTNCIQFVLCTPSTAILFFVTNYLLSTDKKSKTNQFICSIAALPIHVKVEKWIKQKMDKPRGNVQKGPDKMLQLNTSDLLLFLEKKSENVFCIDMDALVSIPTKRRKLSTRRKLTESEKRARREKMKERQNAFWEKCEEGWKIVEKGHESRKFFESKVHEGHGGVRTFRDIFQDVQDELDKDPKYEEKNKSEVETARRYKADIETKEKQYEYFRHHFRHAVCGMYSGVDLRKDKPKALEITMEKCKDMKRFLRMYGLQDHVHTKPEKDLLEIVKTVPSEAVVTYFKKRGIV